MSNEVKIFTGLLIIAFIFQLLIDVGGYLGWYYSRFPLEVFEFSGYDAIIPFKYTFPAYLAWIFFYNISIVSMLMFSKYAKVLLLASLTLSFLNSITAGIYVGTPHEAFLSWFSWSAYIAACTMVFLSSNISAKFIEIK